MENLSINEMLSKHSKNVNTKISAGYSLSGKELLTVTEAKAAIKEIVEKVINKCAEEAKTKLEYDKSKGFGEYMQAIDKESILNVKTQINYGI